MQSETDKKPEPSINAKNALKEAAARKEKIDQANISSKSERDGRAGLDPARFGDWEVKGIASDF